MLYGFFYIYNCQRRDYTLKNTIRHIKQVINLNTTCFYLTYFLKFSNLEIYNN